MALRLKQDRNLTTASRVFTSLQFAAWYPSMALWLKQDRNLTTASRLFTSLQIHSIKIRGSLSLFHFSHK